MANRSKKFAHLIDQGASAAEIAQYLNDLSVSDRRRVALSLRGKRIGKLYALVAGAAPLSLQETVPSSVPAGATVRYLGRNSLPAFNSFEKRLTRTADDLVFGYNYQPTPGTMRVTGPGYFRVLAGDDTHPGELLFDYTIAPPFEPAGWPEYRPNDRGASKLVFQDMKDYVRRVVDDVWVGAAFKLGKAQNAYFLLVRQG